MSFRLRYLLLTLIDSVIIAVSVMMAYFLRFDFKLRTELFIFIPYVIIMHMAIILIVFNSMRLYKRVWQYASIGELISIVKAVTISEVFFFSFHSLIQYMYPNVVVPRSIYLLSLMLIIAGIGGSRLTWRIIRDDYLKIQPYHKRALIIGAGNAGALIAKELKHSPDTEFYPVAFIDDNPSKLNLEVLGLPIVGTRDDIVNAVERYGIQEIIIAIPSAPKSEIAEIINICKQTKANIKILPRVSDLVSGKISVKMIRDVHVEDLLGREPIEIDLSSIVGYVNEKVVLITGAGGSIGSELCRQIAPFSPKRLLLLGHGENSIYEIELELRRKFPNLELETIIADIQDNRRLNHVFETYRPNVVFHAAAHKHVPLMERNPSEAVKNNIFGTKNVAECAHEYGATHFVMISTDKAVNPTSIMGTTKRIAEMIVQHLNAISNTKFVAVRFGNVLGSRGSVIPIFKQQILQGGPVTVTHPEMVRYFMTIPEAVQLVIQAGALAHGGETFILDMGKPVKIDTLARDLIRLSGFEPDKDIKIEYTGIRPGEKLFEEILTDEEGTKATKHDRIFVGRPIEYDKDNLFKMIDKLKNIVSSNKSSSNEIKKILKTIVPTYHFNSETKLNVINRNNYNSNIKQDLEIELSKQELKLAKIELASGLESKATP
ncbi:nucleoside-diphosphate sugar epimerase/dehydratase [Tepidibacillus sp. HK-1]|uniref:nucleoside-diphosphate sugar epimerase/dehydratase n=1 Tax=Tepidibacillus sp. HK-1 TaxID=1883407 RepID=UPI000855221A|nr:nucleoside-diphosphate sugar epimerase/dehydratase [Tepidibacillus sp. HK-1]GBF12579.1 UDP-N-acetyl-alpha-D-glucosamine C6 dehydratase [Tepidibacillus sp. HK-1]